MVQEAWKRNLIDSLKCAADIESQRVAWLSDSKEYFPMPDELVSQLFDDSALDVMMKQEAIFTAVTRSYLQNMSDLVDQIDLNMNYSDLLVSPEWQKFVTMAKHALESVIADFNCEGTGLFGEQDK
jgi:hypothetical protein